MEMVTSRRAMLGAFALAPIALAATIAPAAALTAVDRSEWERAFANMQRHDAAYEAFQPTYEAAETGFVRDKPTGDEINLRHLCPAIMFMGREVRSDLLHRDDLDQLHTDYIANKNVTWGSNDPEASIAKHKADCDTVRQFRLDYQAAKDRHDYDAIIDRDEQLGAAAYDATWALFHMPAPDLAALHWKLEHLFKRSLDDDSDGCDGWSPKVMQSLMADASRLLIGEGR